VKNQNPTHGLTTEEMFPYVQRVQGALPAIDVGSGMSNLIQQKTQTTGWCTRLVCSLSPDSRARSIELLSELCFNFKVTTKLHDVVGSRWFFFLLNEISSSGGSVQ